MKNLIWFFFPPRQWRVPAVIVLGMFAGFGLFALYAGNAFSYLSDDPAACINCHVMAPQYATWQRSSHARVATCNDCHVPQDNVLRTYLFKAQDGLRHASMFTFRLEPQVIHIKDAGMEAVQKNCIRCHGVLTERVQAGDVYLQDVHAGNGVLCWQCHREVPHGRVNSLASTPYARVPRLTPIVPEWIQQWTKP
jgi:cytochrome c nitrite reductase small subunit